jgi:glycerol-3-phosphate dehydrogenase
MRRDLAALSDNVHDVLIIGGGIYGAFCAWDAALRGLSVALVDKGDFGHATSSNNLRIIHGGLRYLQHGDIRRMRESIGERKILMRIAPHLVHPLPFVIPTYRGTLQGKAVMALALALNDLIGFDRNGLSDPEKRLPAGRVISKSECLALVPGIEEQGLTGGAVWYDCQMHNSERMIFAALRSAGKAGAKMANYVEVTGFLMEGDRVTGVRAKDIQTDESFEIRAKVVVNTSGPWVNNVLSLTRGRAQNGKLRFSKAMNLVVNRSLTSGYAVGVPSRFRYKDGDALVSKGSRLLFITPWHNLSLIGTTHAPFDGGPDEFRVTERDIREFVREIDEAYPALSFKRKDVCFVHGGLLPANGTNGSEGGVSLLKQYQVRDHKKEDSVDGLVSVVGVKFTTARGVAQRATDLVFTKLGRKPPDSGTARTPVHGGDIELFEQFMLREADKHQRGPDADVLRHLIYTYGSAYQEVLAYLNEEPSLGERVSKRTPVIKAEIVHGIRKEMAQKLSDVIMRRTELGSFGHPGEEALRTCASIMSRETGWSDSRALSEMEEARAVFSSGSQAE